MRTGAYDFYIRWIRVDYGWTELTLTIGPITFKNPKKFKMTPFLATSCVEIKYRAPHAIDATLTPYR